MKCIKTGCDVFLIQYGAFVHGDAHLTESGDLVIRDAGEMTRRPQSARRHFTMMTIDYWFDQHRESGYGTMIVQAGMFTNHGYEGIDEPAAAVT